MLRIWTDTVTQNVYSKLRAGRMRTGTNSFMTVSRRKHHFIGSITKDPKKNQFRKADPHDRRQRVVTSLWETPTSASGSTRPKPVARTLRGTATKPTLASNPVPPDTPSLIFSA